MSLVDATIFRGAKPFASCCKKCGEGIPKGTMGAYWWRDGKEWYCSDCAEGSEPRESLPSEAEDRIAEALERIADALEKR